MLQIAGIALITTFLALAIKEHKPNFAFLLVLFAGTGIFLFLVDQVQKIISMIESLASSANVNSMYIKTILKIIGIAYIAEFSAQISKDAGLGSMASKVELAGKILILALAVPILTALVETIITMIPSN
ncbi:stage III sporulation protein AD [Lederbergia graminis]|uniref:Stage III sporulation protein AD n=1 Tax=Lederbergia graminis TaxID=735518 RepID=A0ABW0LBC5_9BACI|nr:stage III sporulation protein AD [Paenibacillus bovis]HLU22211.1 stage III sporulation protein AD [Bacillaceae bacterium]